MFKTNFFNFFKLFLIINLLLFIFSCEENKSIVINPLDNIEYEFKVFKLDSDKSKSFRIDEFNSGESPQLYVGNILDADATGNTVSKKSYIYLKIKNELFANSLFCDEEIVGLNNVQLKLPTISDTEDLYFSQYSDYNNLLDCSTLIEESECEGETHCFWYEQLDDYDNEILGQCNFDSTLNTGDQEHVASNSLNAYLLQNNFSNCEILNEDDNAIHSENFINDCSLNDAIKLPVSLSGSYDYLTIDLMGYLYSSINNEVSNGDAGCIDILNLGDCIGNSDCYWQGSPSLGSCEYEAYTNIETNLSLWCDGNAQDDIVLILEYNPISADPNMQLLELYSSNASYLYNNPYIYLNYDKEETEQETVNKYDIISINSSLIEQFLCGGGDCQNFNSDSETWGTILSFDLGVIQNYFSLVDDDLYNDNPDLINCNDITDETICNEHTFCIYNQNECELDVENPYIPLINKDYEGELFQFDIEIDADNVGLIDDISFYLNNVAFIYMEADPSNDNYNMDSNEEGTENNLLWDWNDLNNNQVLDISTDEYEKFDDFGLDSCSDEYERGNIWDDIFMECSNDIYQNKADCLCATNVDESLYNIDGTENNGNLDWEDLDEDNVWTNYEEGEKWYDFGYDLSDDNFESGCFNEDNSNGGTLICWTEESQEDISCSYENVLLEWQQQNPNSNIDDLDIYTTIINNDFEISICGGLHWATECSKCSMNDPNGDNYNIDPSNDNYDQDLDTGEEGNGLWDGIEDGDGICDINECEKFFDFGLDGLPDIYENYSDDVPDDNYNADSNITGTENNLSWDWKDMNGNDEFDIDYDLYEPFFDYGIDQLTSFYEIGINGEVYNSTGRQNDLSYNIYNSDIKEKFDDCGTDGDCNDDDIADDYNADPNNDNFDVDFNPTGDENDGLLTWEDLVEDGVWTNYEEGEQWYDWGYDHLQNSNENNFMGNYANLALGDNNYSYVLINESTDFNKPTTNSDDELVLWISNISKLDNEINKHRITISVHALIDIIAFQLKLEHAPLITEITNVNDNTMLLFPHEFIDADNNLFPSQSELVEDGEQYIIDASIYTLNEVTDYLSINSAYGIKDSLNFISNDEDEVSLETFLTENNNSIISDEYTNLILYFDNSKINHYLYDEVEFHIEYFDEQLNDYVIFSDIHMTNNSIYEEVDSIKIDVGPLVQKYIVNEFDYKNIIISASNLNHNFSNILIMDEEEGYKPRLEIFYSK